MTSTFQLGFGFSVSPLLEVEWDAGGWEPSPLVSAEMGWCLSVALTAGSAAQQWHPLRL